MKIIIKGGLFDGYEQEHPSTPQDWGDEVCLVKVGAEYFKPRLQADGTLLLEHTFEDEIPPGKIMRAFKQPGEFAWLPKDVKHIDVAFDDAAPPAQGKEGAD